MTTETVADKRRECEEAVSGPGKFEAEQPYVPYFWELGLLDCYDDEEVDAESGRSTYVFVVDEDDVLYFPDLLEVGQTVRLVERDDGFVCEV